MRVGGATLQVEDMWTCLPKLQTFGDLVNFKPHLHVPAADGAFLPDGRFVALPRLSGSLLAESFRRAVHDFLVKNGAVSEALRRRMLAWHHGGFSAHNKVSAAEEKSYLIKS